MTELRSRLAATHTAPDKRAASAAPPRSQQAPPAPSPKPVSQLAVVPDRQLQEAAVFQGLQLQLGEPGNPLQSMAVLTHSNVRQLEEYGKDPLSSDRRFLASLQKMAPAPQQRAAAIMQMAAGAVPPPAILVWTAQELVVQARRLLMERLPKRSEPQEKQQQQQQQDPQQQQGKDGNMGSIAMLVSEPWYDGVLQLARITVGSSSSSSSTSPPSTVARTELELLQAFAFGRAAEGAAAAAAAVPYVVSWEALLALPQLQPLLRFAASRSLELATVLELGGLWPATAGGGALPAAAAAALDAAPTGSNGGGKGKQRQKGQVPPVTAPSGGSLLLPALRAAVDAARAKALQVTGLAAGSLVEAPLDADAVLTALALGTGRDSSAGPEQRAAAADWLAAATLLRHGEERLGCAGGASGVRQDVVAALHLLGLPLEPVELSYMDELKVSEQELQEWLSQLSKQLAAGGIRTDDTSAVPVPASLATRLDSARQRLASAGRALVLAATAPKPSVRTGDPQPKEKATQSWLRAVGAPLVSGLLSGGYGSLARLRGMAPELREALVLGLLETGRMQGGTAALTAALYGDADAAWRATRADEASAATAATLLQEEAVAAELDFVHDRHVATPPAPSAPRQLPSDASLAAAVQALPPHTRLLYDSYYVLRTDGGDDAAVLQERRRVAEALSSAGEGAVLQGVGNLQAWLAEARKGLLVLPAPLLALLLRFLRVQVSVTPEAAQSQRNKLTALAILVAEQQRRAVAAAASQDRGDDGASAAAAAAAVRELAEWSRSGGGGGNAAADARAGRVPVALTALLGSSGAVDFTCWLQTLAVGSTHDSTHRMLSMQHLGMDVERYLTMTHEPRLHLPISGLPPSPLSSSSASSSPSISTSTSTSTSTSPSSCRPTTASWTHPSLRPPEAGGEGEETFLEAMRPQLDAYLEALGHRPLGDAEWRLYRAAALEEWEAGRWEREEQLRAAGHSGFFNPRGSRIKYDLFLRPFPADEMYLQQMLEESIPLDDPLGPQSRRYLDTLLRNPSWSFAQRRQAVQRLIQLNAHFARQPSAPEGGSPFAPLFAVVAPVTMYVERGSMSLFHLLLGPKHHPSTMALRCMFITYPVFDVTFFSSLLFVWDVNIAVEVAYCVLAALVHMVVCFWHRDVAPGGRASLAWQLLTRVLVAMTTLYLSMASQAASSATGRRHRPQQQQHRPARRTASAAATASAVASAMAGGISGSHWRHHGGDGSAASEKTSAGLSKGFEAQEELGEEVGEDHLLQGGGDLDSGDMLSPPRKLKVEAVAAVAAAAGVVESSPKAAIGAVEGNVDAKADSDATAVAGGLMSHGPAEPEGREDCSGMRRHARACAATETQTLEAEAAAAAAATAATATAATTAAAAATANANASRCSPTSTASLCIPTDSIQAFKDSLPAPASRFQPSVAAHKYKSPVRRTVLRVKIPWAEPDQLAPGFEQRLADLVSHHGLSLAGTYVRSGCIELVLVLEDLPPEQPSAPQPPSPSQSKPQSEQPRGTDAAAAATRAAYPLNIAAVLRALGLDHQLQQRNPDLFQVRRDPQHQPHDPLQQDGAVEQCGDSDMGGVIAAFHRLPPPLPQSASAGLNEPVRRAAAAAAAAEEEEEEEELSSCVKGVDDGGSDRSNGVGHRGGGDGAKAVMGSGPQWFGGAPVITDILPRVITTARATTTATLLRQQQQPEGAGRETQPQLSPPAVVGRCSHVVRAAGWRTAACPSSLWGPPQPCFVRVDLDCW
ncbi:hypothetical protein VOLCADRAFT_105960 [Volvox carteri f. nagariensis]|uniref:Uncharacterized protein n=1 Tax=Volvox carteri f. nagariensis TaxID=3068 RepID=D8U4I1_VOLCA|nr:uncharacterized protein VOLCADRAFT_105960 [Volvox carteri f. nagariensis]EFJ45507.1 hypothetical protein VOLCADRAFT_105960 [Volvox carteri f. nagariensis]|eukprot:XP_002953534.1 hypothetical protein VOLCADRAFT_105960 [Volvox carteri f. nagariensis]